MVGATVTVKKKHLNKKVKNKTLKTIENQKIPEDEMFVFSTYDWRTNKFKDNEVKYKDATELQKKIINLWKQPKKIKLDITTKKFSEIYSHHCQIARDYLIDHMPPSRWITYKELIDKVGDELDKEIIKRSVLEKNYWIDRFVDRRYNQEKKVIEYRANELTSLRHDIKRYNLDKEYVESTAANIKLNKDFRTIAKAIAELADYIPDKGIRYEDMVKLVPQKKKKDIKKILPLHPSLIAYEMIISELTSIRRGKFIDFWYEKKDKTYYLQEKDIVRCKKCKKTLGKHNHQDTIPFDGKINLICSSCKTSEIRHINKIVDIRNKNPNR